MAKVMASARLDGELLGWAKVYAKRRDVTLASVLEAALREFREACGGGPSPEGVVAVRAQVDAAPKSVVVPRPAQSEWARTMAERQARLNKGR